MIRRAAVLLPLLLALALSARTVNRESCTVDEFGNLPLTVAYWSPGALHIDPGNPPLTRWIQGLPWLLDRPDLGATRVELDAIRTSWDLGYRFEAAHRTDYHSLLVRARAGSVALFLLAVLGVWRLARDLAGPRAAVAAAFVAAASPNLLAHGRLVTPDIGVSAFTVWAVWAAVRAMRGGRAGASAAGALAGLAALAKFSALLLLPVLGLLLLASPGRLSARLARMLVFGGVALLTLYAGYGFPPPGSFLDAPTVLPAPLTAGLEAQINEDPYPAYLLGENRDGGWPWYYVVAFLVKVPWPTLLLAGLALAVLIRERPRGYWIPVAVAAAFFLAFGFATDKNIGIRYLLPVLPLLAAATAAVWGSASGTVRRLGAVALVGSVLSGVAGSGAPIAYFNGAERFLGGKRAVLADSNLDWGQALPDLKDWMEREGIPTVQLAYFGRIDPSVYGISWKAVPQNRTRGPVAISATLAVGRPYLVRVKRRPEAEARIAWSAPGAWSWVRDEEPDTVLGDGSILVWKDFPAP